MRRFTCSKALGQSRAKAGPTWARGRATLGHSLGQALKNRGSQVSDSVTRYDGRLGQQNKGAALICRDLRYVWKKYEVRRTELDLEAPDFLNLGRYKPANKEVFDATTAFLLRHTACIALIILLGALIGSPAISSQWGSSGSFDADEAKLMREKLTAKQQRTSEGWGSFTADQDWVSLDKFERSKPGSMPRRETAFVLPRGPDVDQLYALISFAESPHKGYDSIHMSATRLPAHPPRQLTLGQIKTWIADTPGQHHAIGRYQIIPSTFLNLQKRLVLSDTTLFNQETQDLMASLLLKDAGYIKFQSGRISRSKFMDNLAAIWAGLPLDTGKSAYHGKAGNRATITHKFYAAQMARIFPRSGERKD